MSASEGGELHRKAIANLLSIGEACGLESRERWVPSIYTGADLRPDDAYTPFIDVVWLLDLRRVLSHSYAEYRKMMTELTSNEGIRRLDEDDFGLIPIAAFEVVGHDATSKVVATDILNMIAGHVPFAFEIVREFKGGMNVKRAERIAKTSQFFEGWSNVLVINYDMLAHVTLMEQDIPCVVKWKDFSEAVVGAEASKEETQIRHRLLELGRRCGLKPVFEYSPEEVFRGLEKKELQEPRFDAAFFLKIPRQVSSALRTLSSLSRMRVLRDLCHLPLLAFETERRTSGKHSVGGIVNLARYATFGFSVASDSELQGRLQRAVNLYSHAHGFNNVFVCSYDTILQKL